MNYIEEIKKIGKYFEENAEGVIGSTDDTIECNIWIRFGPGESVPSIEISKEIKC